MSREVRRVPAYWQHPTEGHYTNGAVKYKSLFDGAKYAAKAKDFMEMANTKGLQEAIDEYGCLDQNDYMPLWSDEERTHYMMYETISEGTPISPAFATPEELARWLADTGASAFGRDTASYESWLRVAKGGWAPSAVYTPETGLINGVDGCLAP